MTLSTAGPTRLGSFSRLFGALAEPKGRKYRVFISHSGKQKPHFVDILLKALADRWPNLATTQSIFIDRDSLQPGDAALKEIHEALQDSFVAVVVLSAAFLDSPDPMDELHLLLERICGNPSTKAKVIPIFYDVSWKQAAGIASDYSRRASAHKTLEPGACSAGDDDLYTRLDVHVGEQPGHLLIRHWAEDLQALVRTTGFVPEQVPHGRAIPLAEEVAQFVGDVLARMDELPTSKLQSVPELVVDGPVLPGNETRLQCLRRQVDLAAAERRVVLVHGLPLVGKTVLAKRLFNEKHKEHLTVPCCFLTLRKLRKEDNKEQVVLEKQRHLLKELAVGKRYREPSTVSEAQTTLLSVLRGRQVLLVVDNAWDGLLQQLLPQGLMEALAAGSVVLVTSRGCAPYLDLVGRGRATIWELGCLSEEESKVLLRQAGTGLHEGRLPQKQDCSRFLELCGGLPGALTALAEYKEDLNADGAQAEELLAVVFRASSPSVPGTVFKAFQQSWDALGSDQRQALLDVIWFLDGQVELLMDPRLELYLQVGVLIGLQKVGLLQLWKEAGSAGQMIRVHAVVQAFCSAVCDFEAAHKSLKAGNYASIPPNQVKNAVALWLECHEVSNDTLAASTCLRLLQMHRNRCVGCKPPRLLLKELRWVLCEQDKAAETLALELTPSGSQSKPNRAVVTLQSLPDLKNVSITWGDDLKALQLEDCRHLQFVNLGGLRNLSLLKVTGCDNLASFEVCPSVLGPECLTIVCDSSTVAQGSLAALTSLQELALTTASIPRLPDTVSCLIALRGLTLSACTGLTTLPSCMDQLRELKHLSISECDSLQRLAPPASVQQLHISTCSSLTRVVALAASHWEVQQAGDMVEAAGQQATGAGTDWEPRQAAELGDAAGQQARGTLANWELELQQAADLLEAAWQQARGAAPNPHLRQAADAVEAAGQQATGPPMSADQPTDGAAAASAEPRAGTSARSGRRRLPQPAHIIAAALTKLGALLVGAVRTVAHLANPARQACAADQPPAPPAYISGALSELREVIIRSCPNLAPAPCPAHLPDDATLFFGYSLHDGNLQRQEWMASAPRLPCTCTVPVE